MAASARFFARVLGEGGLAFTHKPCTWSEEELGHYKVDTPVDTAGYKMTAYSRYNPTPGTGRTGFSRVGPNNFPFYTDEEKYMPVLQSDGGQLSEWQAQYAPSKEQAEEDRAKAYAAGVPHGYQPAGAAPSGNDTEKSDLLELWVVSELHDESEYGEHMDAASGAHSGGPFRVRVHADMRVEELRKAIWDVGGIPPALSRLSYGGKAMEDAQRTLQHYGIAYWHARFPHWPIKVRKY